MAANSTRLNIGVVGAGYVATAVHIPFLQRLPLARVAAVADSVPGRAEAAASRYGIPVHASDYRRLLDESEIDVIDVCTPPQTHARIACDALAAGKHVILEKPAVMNMREFADVSDALARAPHSHLGMVLNLRYMPLIRSAIQVLHGGRLGAFRGASAVIHTTPPAVDWFGEPGLARYGVLYDYLPHIIDTVAWALQATPTAVRCLTASQGKGYYLILEFRSPLAGETSLMIDVTWTSSTSIRSVQFWGTEADLFVDLQDQFWYLGRGHLTPIKRGQEFAKRMTALARRAAGGRVSIRYGAMMYHQDLLGEYLAAFSAGQSPPVSLPDALAHVAVIDAAIRSHAEDRKVPVSLDPLVPA